MKALKNLSLILLLVLTFTGCHDKSSKLADFNRAVYTPEYASGFDIKGADGKKSVLVTVTNPWQGADSITTYLLDRKSTRLNSSHTQKTRMPSSA